MATDPTRSIGYSFLSELLKYGSKQVYLNPFGYAGGYTKTLTKNDPVITNPYGVKAGESSADRGYDESSPFITLEPGQSFNIITGQYSDPNLHANTAARLNASTNQRLAGIAGLGQASQTSARNSTSVLATLDQMYYANQKTNVTTSYELSGLAQAKSQGFNTTSNKTVLGVQSPQTTTATKTALKRALS